MVKMTILQTSVQKKIVIASAMAVLVDSVRCLFKAFVLISVRAMYVVVVIFVRQIKAMSIDRLSALPDSTLCEILSYLEMKEAAITCVLSKRWQFLWTKLPCLEFWESSKDIEKICKFVARVHKTLVLCSRNNLEKLDIGFQYNECFASDVNVWVEFAVKVPKVYLLLTAAEKLHRLPQIMYSNSSLTTLWVQGCIMAPRKAVEWPSLTELDLYDVELDESAIEKILSGCPVLRSLALGLCRGFNRVNVNSPSVHKLEIKDGDDESLLKISAPFLQSLDIKLLRAGRKLNFTNIESGIRAYIEVEEPEWGAVLMNNTKLLFQKIQNVKELQLGPHCVKVLSMLVLNGWQIPQSTVRRRLKLDAYCEEHSIYGIIGLLESCPNLETFVIEGYDLDEESVSTGSTARRDLNCDLLHLKVVDMIGYADPNLAGEPMLTMARILLERAIALEKMVINVDKQFSSSSSEFTKVAQKLLNYSRASRQATVVLL